MNSPYCLTKKDLAIGESPRIILIEKHMSFDHLNISVCLKNPGNIIYFDKPGSKLPQCGPELISSDLDIGKIKKLNIGYLLFSSPEAKNYLNAQKNIKSIRKLGDWILYKII
ncbi:MAG TPA: hypothetical protein VMT35_11110 [Ignavibacteriaceae bacterium]|nr:hypothetical protein [Ignavibacteriaceae bacterium]